MYMRQHFSRQLKISGLLITTISLVGLIGCEKKPIEKVEQKPPTQTVQQQVPILDAKIEQISVVIPECKGPQCPEVDILHLKSNYPKIDQVVDHYILDYVSDLVQGFDLSGQPVEQDVETVAVSAVESPIVDLNAKQGQQIETVVSPNDTNTLKLQNDINKFVQLAQEVKSLGSPAQLTLYIKPQILNPQGPISTVVINASNYIGGAHGSAAQQYYNFDLKHQSLLSLDQIIQNGKRTAFNELAYAAFEQWIKETQPDMDIKNYQQLWKFTLTENFYLSDNGLILQYGEYEIGPYAVGLPRLVIPYSQLQGILKPQYLPGITTSPIQATTTAHLEAKS